MRAQADRDEEYETMLEKAGWDLGTLLNVTLPEPELIPDIGIEREVEVE